MSKIFNPILMICAIFLISCTNGIKKSEEVVRGFVAAATDQDSVEMVKYYPSIKPYISKLDKIEDVEIDDVSEKDKVYSVKCTSGFYDEKSRFVQNKVTFFVEKTDKGWLISDSKGMIHLPPDMGNYPEKIGAIKETSRDREIGQKYDDIVACFFSDLFSHTLELVSGIKKLNWSWEADWGTPNGNCTIRNTLPFSVSNVKYKITYYNGGEVVGTDDGTAASSMDPGETKSFSFYSSGVNGYKAQSAGILFEVPEEYALEWTLSQPFSGNEFAEFKKRK